MPISESTLDAFKQTRLSALADAPLAFGSTYAAESSFTDEQWRQRLLTWSGPRSVCYLAWDDTTPCGIAAGLLDPADGSRAYLVSMWVAPTHRRQHVGRQLVEAVLNWASGLRIDSVYLSVTSVNASAMLFYEQFGFVKTGRTEPYPNAAGVIEYEMVCMLTPKQI